MTLNGETTENKPPIARQSNTQRREHTSTTAHMNAHEHTVLTRSSGNPLWRCLTPKDIGTSSTLLWALSVLEDALAHVPTTFQVYTVDHLVETLR